jgi:hypothetical protein
VRGALVSPCALPPVALSTSPTNPLIYFLPPYPN